MLAATRGSTCGVAAFQHGEGLETDPVIAELAWDGDVGAPICGSGGPAYPLRDQSGNTGRRKGGGPGRKAVRWLGSVCSELVLRAFEKRGGSLVKGGSRSPEDWSRIEFRDD